MRIVILSSSVYSETACAMTLRLAAMEHIPAGALALSTLSRGTLLRKLGQMGARKAAHYARTKLLPQRNKDLPKVQNPYLLPLLKHQGGIFRSMREVAAVYGFHIAPCKTQNSPHAFAQL